MPFFVGWLWEGQLPQMDLISEPSKELCGSTSPCWILHQLCRGIAMLWWNRSHRITFGDDSECLTLKRNRTSWKRPPLYYQFSIPLSILTVAEKFWIICCLIICYPNTFCSVLQFHPDYAIIVVMLLWTPKQRYLMLMLISLYLFCLYLGWSS